MKPLYEQIQDVNLGLEKLQVSASELDSAIDRLGRRLKWLAVGLWSLAGLAFSAAAVLYYYLP